ncbi:MAG: hypothetical protein L0Z62_08965 [Gemmataceae bacterium]|nr:hypothetical protein [Gemmataceae bacterium]
MPPSHRRPLWPLFVLGLLLLAPQAVSAQPNKRPLTVEDLWKALRVGKPALSPDGKWVAVDVTRPDMEKNDSTTTLWLLAADGKPEGKPLKWPKASTSGGAWSPDGEEIAFVAKDRDKVGQICLVSRAGGKTRQLTDMPMTPSALKWSRDGKTIFCVGLTWLDTPDDDSYRKKEKAQKEVVSPFGCRSPRG